MAPVAKEGEIERRRRRKRRKRNGGGLGSAMADCGKRENKRESASLIEDTLDPSTKKPDR